MQNQLTKQKYQTIVLHIYDDLSECLKIFKANVNNMRKSILSSTIIAWNPEAEQNQLKNKKNSLVVKYYNISYKNEGLELQKIKLLLRIIHRFLCRVKQVIENQVSRIAANSSVNLIRWIKYIKSSLFSQGYPQQTSIGKIMQILLFPLQPQKAKTERKEMVENKSQSEGMYHIAQQFVSELIQKNSILNRQRNRSDKIINGQPETKDKKTNIKFHSSQNKIQKILQKFKINYSAISILGIQQSEYRDLFFSARECHIKKKSDIFNQMKFRNRFIADLINHYDAGFCRYKQRSKRAEEKERKRHSASDLTMAQIKSCSNQNQDSQSLSFSSRKGKKLVKSNNMGFGVNSKDRSFYTLYNYKSRRNNTSLQKNIQNNTQNLTNDLALYQKTQRNILLNLGKVIFSGNKLALYPKSSEKNEIQKKSRLVFYKRSRQYQRKKPSSNIQKRIFQINKSQINQNIGFGIQISTYKK